MKNYVQPAEVITITAAGTVTAGSGVLFGDLVGVALHGATSGQDLTLVIRGVVTLAKAAGTINPGVMLYWDNSTGRATTTASGNRPIGFHAGKVANAGSAGDPILVLLQPTIVATEA